jgi:AcrR family transcriptional regulator
MSTSFTRRTRRDPAINPTKGDRRERQLLASAEILVNRGEFDDKSVAQLAAEADLTRPTFYFYFASKQALLTALVDAALKEIMLKLTKALAAPSSTPATSLRAAIAGAADAWWEHRAVMLRAVELSAAVPAIYEREMETIDAVNQMCVELVMEHGSVPEAGDRSKTQALVLALALMNERNLHHALRSCREREDLVPTEELLHRIWTRAAGLPTAT